MEDTNSEKLKVLRWLCNVFREKLTNKKLIERGLDKDLVNKEMSFVSNLIREGKVGNFSNNI